MSQVKEFVKNKVIKHLYINTTIVNDKKVLDTKSAPEGTNELKKPYEVLHEINTTRTHFNTIAIDTSKFHQLDCDNKELFDKYFGYLNLNESTPYYLSVHKKLPHYFVKITNLPGGMSRKGIKYGNETVTDLLVSQWAWCSMNCELINPDKEPMPIDWATIKEIDEQIKIDFKKQNKNEKEKLKEQKNKINEQKKRITELKKKKLDDDLEDINELLGLSVKINRTHDLLIEMLPKEVSDDRNKWINVGYVIFDMYRHDYQAGLRKFKRFSKLSSKYDGDKIEEEYASFKNSKRELTIGTIDYYLKEANERLYNVYKMICQTIDCQFRDQDLANIFYDSYKEDYVCAYFEPKDCWFKYENGIYTELNGKTLIVSLMPELGKKLLTYRAAYTYAQKIFEKLQNEANYDDPDIEHYIKLTKFYKSRIDDIKTADDWCNSAKGQIEVYKCCRATFYKEDFLKVLNKNINLLGFEDYVFDLTKIKSLNLYNYDNCHLLVEQRLDELFRKSTKEDYISVKTGMTKDECMNSDIKMAIDYLKSVFPTPGQYEYMLTLLSDSIYGKNRQRFCVNMGIGKNSKSLLQSLMKRAFGGYFGTMKPSFITAKDDENCSSANSELYACKYVRSLWISEPPENKSLNGSRMKLLAGNDAMTVRELYKASEDFTPQFSIYINCNKTFKLESCSDISLPRRIKFNPFTQFFTKNPDPKNKSHSLEDPNLENEEYLVKLSRSLMKLLLIHYVSIDLKDLSHDVDSLEPQICKDTKKQFIETGDSFQEFFDQGYELTPDNRKNYVSVMLFYTDYVQYCRNYQYKPLSKNLFVEKVQMLFVDPKKYYFPKTTSVIIDGEKKWITNVFKGIREKDIDEINECISDSDDEQE